LGRKGFFPPLGLEFIATVIRPFAREVDVVDLRMETGHTKDFIHPETDMVCFSINWNRESEFIHEEIRSIPSEVFTLIGGRHATEDPEHWFTACPGVDAVVRGDGEEVVEEMCRGVPLEEIPGLSFRRNGEIVHNPNRTLGPVRDDLFPERTKRRYTYFVSFENISTGILIDTISASRGCPFNCTFCSFNRNPWGEKRKWSMRSPESVVDELSQIDAKVVGFTDDLFTHDMDFVEQICDMLIARGIRKHYIINARLEIAKRPKVLRKMEQAGFCMLLMGVESAHDKTLRSMRKGFDTAKIREYFRVLRTSSMILHGYFILGSIGESLEEMKQIVPFAQEIGVDTIALSTLRDSPYSGLRELIAAHPGYHLASNGKIYSDEYSAEELRLLRRRMYRQFFTPGQMGRVIRKAIRLGVLGLLPPMLLRAPRIILNFSVGQKRRTKRRRAKPQLCK
jgi:radical SAM superfamily enzyme YgiQ (UPF0313 family)